MSFDHVIVERQGAVSVLTMASGKLNAISPGMLEDVHRALDQIENDPETSALIVTGGDSRFFSYGLDVAHLLTLDRPGMTAFLAGLNSMLKRFYFFPRPVVAAINGHAMAGGLLLAMTADLRVMAEGDFTVGLSEIKLGLAAPAASVRILARRIGHARCHALCLSGESYDPATAKQLDLIDELVPAEMLMQRALIHADKMGELPRKAFVVYESYLNAVIYEVTPEREKRENESWLDLWFDPETQTRLRRLVERV